MSRPSKSLPNFLKKGLASPTSKFQPFEVIDIATRGRNGESIQQLADEYKANWHTISNIVRGRSFKSILEMMDESVSPSVEILETLNKGV